MIRDFLKNLNVPGQFSSSLELNLSLHVLCAHMSVLNVQCLRLEAGSGCFTRTRHLNMPGNQSRDRASAYPTPRWSLTLGRELLQANFFFVAVKRSMYCGETSKQQTPVKAVKAVVSLWWGSAMGSRSHLVVALQVPELLHLKQVSLHGEQRHLGVLQDGQRDGGQL